MAKSLNEYLPEAPKKEVRKLAQGLISEKAHDWARNYIEKRKIDWGIFLEAIIQKAKDDTK